MSLAVADSQRELLETEAKAHEEMGAIEAEDLLDDVGARVSDGLDPAPDGGVAVERHPSA